MDHDIPVPEGWQGAWLERDSPLQDFAFYLPVGLSSCAGLVAIVTIFQQWRQSRKLSRDEALPREILAAMDRQAARLTKFNFFSTMIYMLIVVGISLVDAYISILVLRDDAEENPEEWDRAFFIELAFYTIYSLAIFLTAFFAVPFLQLLLAYRFLTFHARRSEKSSFASHISGARFATTQLALSWAMLAFAISSCWPPLEVHSQYRWIALQACCGSAYMWMDASMFFNFFASRLQEEELDLAPRGVLDAVAVILKAIRMTHRPQSEGLPVVEVAEKTPLIEASERN